MSTDKSAEAQFDAALREYADHVTHQRWSDVRRAYQHVRALFLAGPAALAAPPAAPDALPAPEQVSNSPFDAALHAYAKATWHHDMAGMRAGYIGLRDLFARQFAAAPTSATTHALPAADSADAVAQRNLTQGEQRVLDRALMRSAQVVHDPADAVAQERKRIEAAVMAAVMNAENCEDDGPEVDTARKALATVILAAIRGLEPKKPPQGSLFDAP